MHPVQRARLVGLDHRDLWDSLVKPDTLAPREIRGQRDRWDILVLPVPPGRLVRPVFLVQPVQRVHLAVEDTRAPSDILEVPDQRDLLAQWVQPVRRDRRATRDPSEIRVVPARWARPGPAVRVDRSERLAGREQLGRQAVMERLDPEVRRVRPVLLERPDSPVLPVPWVAQVRPVRPERPE